MAHRKIKMFCIICGELADSLYLGDKGPFCSACYHRLTEYSADLFYAAKAFINTAICVDIHAWHTRDALQQIIERIEDGK